MAGEGFEALANISTTISSGEDAFPSNVQFKLGPPSSATFVREIQIQIYAATSSILSVRRNGTDYPINNNVAVVGSITFTILVFDTDTLNIRTDGTSIALNIIVGG